MRPASGHWNNGLVILNNNIFTTGAGVAVSAAVESVVNMIVKIRVNFPLHNLINFN